MPATLLDGGITNIVPRGPGWMFTSTWPTAPARGAPADGHLVWAWAADRRTYPDDVDDLSPAQLRDLVGDRISGWSPVLRLLVAETDASTVARVPLRTMPSLPPWAASTVTLLGDAVHNMTPMAGIGANTALRDADELRRTLTAPGSLSTVSRVDAYERRMRRYANQALATSTRNARTATSTGRLPRLAFRTALRIAGAVPPVHRATPASPRR
jgi:2-polyprenyl-6-methoxyphenol hydroxylase-like FAD-dependent oxidoreductase